MKLTMNRQRTSPINTPLLAQPINTFAVKPAPVGRSQRGRVRQFCAMGSAAFERRWSYVQELREQGHVELSDFLGSADVEPLKELGLLESTGYDHPYARYQGCMPTLAGKQYFAHHFLRQVIMLKPGYAEDLHAMLMLKAQPLWLPTGTGSPSQRSGEHGKASTFSWTGHHTYDPAMKQRDEMERLLATGYLPLDEVWNVHRIDTMQLIAARLCEYTLKEGNTIVYTLQPTEKGAEYLYGPPALGRLFLKPGMGAELFKACLRDSEERLGATG